MLAVPPAILELLHLQAGATVSLTVAGGHLVVERMRRPRYTLGELLAQCEAAGETTEEDRDWLNDAPVGNELP